jgi:hypothetical protein
VSRYRDLSDPQANAEALARRSTPYSEAHRLSVSVAYDWTKRQPSDLREAVRMARQAYADEVPGRMTEGPGAIGDDGAPRFAPETTSYIFGNARQTDAGRDPEPGFISYYLAPFRATLDRMACGDETSKKRAAIVGHVTIGSQGPQQAAIAEGVPAWCAKLVAFDALTSFLRSLSDVRVDARQEHSAA